MTGYRFLFGSALVSLIVLLACGGAATPSELIIGTWDAEMMGETLCVEFLSDGTVRPEGEEMQRYIVIEGESTMLQFVDMNTDVVYVELELVFNGENQCTLSGERMTATLNRVE